MNPDNLAALPHSLIAEKCVVSAIFNDPDLMAECPTLSENHFHLTGTKRLYQTLQQFSAHGKPFDIELILQHLIDTGNLDRVGGPSAVIDLLNFSIDPTKFRLHVQTLTDKLARRMALQAAEAIIEAANHQTEDSEALLDATSAPITAIHDTLLSIKPSETMNSVLLGIMADIEAKIRGQKSPMGIKTGIPVIDNRFLGIHPGKTVIISGYPSGGKSVLGGQFCAEAFMAEHQTLFVSLEMSKQDLASRMIAYVSRLEGKAITDPATYALTASNGDRKTLSKHELLAIQNACLTIQRAPFDIERLTGANEQTIAAVIRKHHRKNPLKVVVVDFAQRIRASAETRTQSREQQLSHASKVMADLAAELGFAMILLSQLNKEGAAKHAEALNEDCDLHLQILQDKETKDHLGIAVPKDRHCGQMGALLPVYLNEAALRFEERYPEKSDEGKGKGRKFSES